jgi:ABC-type transporter Mla MlaB component
MFKPSGNTGWLGRLSGLLDRVRAAGRPDLKVTGPAESSIGKRTLKATIERNRKNDQARREELDRLRQLRRQGPSTASEAIQTAAEADFHSRVMRYPEAQSITLRKIDAIEAQMSRYWWKGRVDPLSPADAWQPPEAVHMAGEFTVSAPDVELEQAALSFANGDLAGAQQALHTALRAAPPGSALAPRWAAALLDLARITGQRALFDAAASDYGRHFERDVPGWFSVSDALAPPAPAVVLRGELRGDMPDTLAGLQRPLSVGVPVAVSCAELVRVDFSAGGTLLTWVMGRQQAGCNVRFDDVPHLVAAFFHVIGIDEHAKVVPRTR